MSNPFEAIAAEARRQDLEEKALNHIKAAKFKLLNATDAKMAFFANLALQLEVKLDWSCPTMATDGESLFVNPQFCDGLSAKERLGVLAHEILHCVFEHPSQLDGVDKADANSAMDLSINQILRGGSFELPSSRLMVGEGAYEDFPPDKSWKEYYRLIQERKKPPEPEPEEQEEEEGGNQDPDQEDSDSAGDGDEGESGDDQDGDEGESGDDQEGDGDGNETDGEGEGDAGDSNGQDDASSDGDGDASGADNGDGQEGSGGGDGGAEAQGGGQPSTDPGKCGEVRPCHPDERGETEAKWHRAVIQASELVRSRGDLPAGLARLVGKITNPPADWKEILREFLMSKAKNDVNWNRPNRRFVHQGLYLPGKFSEELGEVIIVVDCSGSITDDIVNRFGNEIEAILGAYEGTTASILYHDYDVTHEQKWDPVEGPLVLEPKGGGGTSHIPVFKRIEKGDEAPSAVVCLTDMISEFPTRPPEFPVLWCVVGDWRGEPPFGQVVYLDEEP